VFLLCVMTMMMAVQRALESLATNNREATGVYSRLVTASNFRVCCFQIVIETSPSRGC